MTARLVFEAMLVELNNTSSPSLLLDDYNHFINKAIDIYINKRYANYDVTQQTTDDLRVLKSTAILPVTKRVLDNSQFDYPNTGELSAMEELSKMLDEDKSFDAIYEVNLPSDYLHTLNCTCVYKVNKQSGCYDEGNTAKYAAKRLTADSWSTIMNDYYNRPAPKRPYYYIHNINTSTELPTNPLKKNVDVPAHTIKMYGLYDSTENVLFGIIIDEEKISIYYREEVGSFNIAITTSFGGLYSKYIGKDIEVDWKKLTGETNITSTTFDNIITTISLICLGTKEAEVFYIDYDLEVEDDDELNLKISETFSRGMTEVTAFMYADDLEVPDTYKVDLGSGTDINGSYSMVTRDGTDSSDNLNLARMLTIGKTSKNKAITSSLVLKEAGVRYGNASTVRMEIRYGQGDVFELKGVLVDYIKAPQHIRLTKNQFDLTEDTSQQMEFPDYVCQEIINLLVTLVMANNGDPRIQTVPLVSQSIADLAAQQAQAKPAPPARG